MLLASDPNVAIVPALAQVTRSGGVSEQRRDASRAAADGRTCFLSNAFLAGFGPSIALKTVHIQPEGFRQRPQMGRVLAPLVGQQPSGKRPEGTLEVGGFDGTCRPAGRLATGLDDEVAQVHANANLGQPPHDERAVRTGQVRVDDDEGRAGRAVDAQGVGLRRFDPGVRLRRSPFVRIHALTRTHQLEGTPDDVFPFFADAFNLESITPPLLKFGLLTPAPIVLGLGTVIQYGMRLHGVPVNWTSSIQGWEPPHRFVDTQIRGPFRFWHHTHRFEALPGGRTLMTDDVRYALPVQPLGELALPFVRRDLKMIFDYRASVIEDRLAAAAAARST